MPDPIPLVELQQHLLELIRESLYPPGRRVQISLASLLIVHDHHRAIAILIEKRLHASAFALARPLYEALVKGMWLSHCAPESQLEAFAGGKELKTLNDLTEDLLASGLSPLVSNSIRNYKQKYWKVMSSFTHAGHAQVKRWLSATGVEPTYQDAEVKEISIFTAFMTVVATMEMARLSSNDAALQIIGKMLPVAGES